MLFQYITRESSYHGKDVATDSQKSVSWFFKSHFPQNNSSEPPKLHGSKEYNNTILGERLTNTVFHFYHAAIIKSY